MNILICFKVVPDLNMLSDEDWIVNANLEVDVSFARVILNCFDESAIEMGLKLRDEFQVSNSECYLTALTIGDESADLCLKTLNSLRFDKTVRVNNNKDLRFWPEIITEVISQFASKVEEQDVLLFGMQSDVGNNAKTPLLVAEKLGHPCITQVIEITKDSNETLKVISLTDNGILKQTITTPCVLSIGNAPKTYMRVPTLKDRMTYGKKPIEVLDLYDFDVSEILKVTYDTYKVKSLKKINNKRESIIIKETNSKENAQALYNFYLKERLKQL
ncbi:electron transfer flavoprotein subunit beta/FixA family protein [Tepidanaerobacter syntrophicus]|uniref:electron transfer flavoprotein subunit beta/FixA family protein n=1 Tax=Tepidanaerobacter syntrophicus TaxID=224999 RepID=UPI001BD25834|nr:hypothetical protein [Tepidanaerobacter syntrophicus]